MVRSIFFDGSFEYMYQNIKITTRLRVAVINNNIIVVRKIIFDPGTVRKPGP